MNKRKAGLRAPESPSWRTLQDKFRGRSSSLPRIRLSRRQSNTVAEQPTQNITWKWLTGPMKPASSNFFSSSGSSMLDNSFGGDSQNLAPPVKQRKWRRMPVLTMVLLKLEDNMPDYSKLLAEPSFDNISAACALLDTSVATASSPGSSQMGSPASMGSPSRNLSPRHGSPSLSPLSWLNRGYGDNSPTSTASSSAMALEGEWESIVAPLFLLASAEVLYADLSHTDQQLAHNLTGLYQRIRLGLISIRDTLCGPFIAAAADHGEDTPVGRTGAPLSTYFQKAISLSASLDILTKLVDTRIRLIEFHGTLWTQGQPNIEDLVRFFPDWFPAANARFPEEEVPDAAAKVVWLSLDREVKTWRYLLETCYSLERCRFAETILACQSMKKYLDSSSSTTLKVWFRRTLQHILAVFPIMFDRVEVFSKPLYGFQKDSMENKVSGRVGPSQDLETEIVGFIRRFEKAGGPPISVAVVLDAAGANNPKVELGFRATEPTSFLEMKALLSESEMLRAQWPAIYIRSSTRRESLASAGSSSSNGLLKGMRRSVSKSSNRSRTTDGDETLVSSRTLKSWSSDGSGPNASGTMGRKNTALLVLEYAPESGGNATVWPHSCWSQLVPRLEGSTELAGPITETIHENDNSQPLQEESGPLSLAQAGFALLWPGTKQHSSASDENINPRPRHSSRSADASSSGDTSFFVSSLGEFLWLAIMVKDSSGKNWRRRSTMHSTKEIQEFLYGMSSYLRIGNCFLPHRVDYARKELDRKRTTGTSSPDRHLRRLQKEMLQERMWDDKDLQEILHCVKEIFGLKSPRNVLADTQGQSLGMGFRAMSSLTPATSRRIQVTRPSKHDGFDRSVAALFLGSDLLHSVGYS